VLRTRRPLLALLLLGALLAGGYLLSALRSDGSTPHGSAPAVNSASRVGPVAPSRGADGLATVRSSDLPVQAQQVLRLIDAGGPFPYPQDGEVFGNVERLLPIHPRGWYQEYTVPTPGSPDRGTRYYTADH
jgi:ribonuclease T1